MYIALLDSVISGHPFESNANEDWWRANTKGQQNQVVSVAHAALLLRILYGDNIVLSHNQIFDSYAWMSAAKNLVNAEFSSQRIPITWAAYKIENPSPDSLIETAIKIIFSPEGNSKFHLSAWPGIDRQQGEIIAQNISKNGSFINMLRGVKYDDKYYEVFNEQEEALCCFYDYIKARYTGDINWKIESPTVIKRTDASQGGDFSIWRGLESCRDQKTAEFDKVLDHIKNELNGRNLEQRSFLYSALADITDNELRADVRKVIDYYNYKTSMSVCNGNGLFSVLDQNPFSPIFKDEKLIDQLTNETHDCTTGRKEVIGFVPGNYKELQTLKLYDCLEILKDPEIITSLRKIKETMFEHPSKLGKSGQIFAYWQWRHRMDDVIDNHERLLAQKSEGKIKLKNGKLMALLPSAVLGLGAFVSVELIEGFVVSLDGGSSWNFAEEVPHILKYVFEVTGVVAPELIRKFDPNKIPTSAVARIRRKYHESIIRNY